MAQRLSETDVRGMFERLCSTLGVRVATSDTDHGGYWLERNDLGYMVTRINDTNTGVSCPLGQTRHSAREMFERLHAACLAIELYRDISGARPCANCPHDSSEHLSGYTCQMPKCDCLEYKPKGAK